MSRGTHRSFARAAGVWLVVTATTGAALVATWPLAAGGATAAASFADLLVRVSGLALGVAMLRLWLVTTVTVAQLVVGRTPSGDGLTRRWVLLACGAALAAGVVSPASATEGDHVLEGLRLPERAVAGPLPESPSRPATPAADVAPAQPPVHVVTAGESLWSIAAQTSGAGADLDARWRSIWAANRDVVGDDPHLILPGQRLRIPSTHEPSTHEPSTHETGDRP